MNSCFTSESRNCLDLFQCAYWSQNLLEPLTNASVGFQMKIRKISRSRELCKKYPELGHFTLLFCKGTELAKCAEIYNARTQLLFCFLFFRSVLVAVVLYLRSVRDLTQSTTATAMATATRTSSSNRFEEQNNSCARALYFFVHGSLHIHIWIRHSIYGYIYG